MVFLVSIWRLIQQCGTNSIFVEQKLGLLTFSVATGSVTELTLCAHNVLILCIDRVSTGLHGGDPRIWLV